MKDIRIGDVCYMGLLSAITFIVGIIIIVNSIKLNSLLFDGVVYMMFVVAALALIYMYYQSIPEKD